MEIGITMKKVLKKILACAAILSMIGAGSSAMALSLKHLPRYDRGGNLIHYKFMKDTGLAARIYVDGRVHCIKIQNKGDMLKVLGYKREGERNFSYLASKLPDENGAGNELTYSYKDGTLSVTLWKDGIPTAPKVVGKYGDEVVYFTRDGLRTVFGI